MKLHLPKSLRTALFAAFASVVSFTSSAYAGWVADDNSGLANTPGNVIYYLELAQSGTAINKQDVVNDEPNDPQRPFTKVIIVSGLPDGSPGKQNATLSSVTIEDADTLAIYRNPWTGTVRDFDKLLIEKVLIGDGTGNAILDVGANQVVQINAVSGMLSSVSNAGTLTLGAVTIGGTVTNSGTLKLTRTLAGSGSVTGGRVEFDTTGNLSFYDGMAYKYANSDTANDIKVGFITEEQTFRIFGEGVSYSGVAYDASGNEYNVSDGSVTMNVGNSTVFYVDGTWNYNAEQSAGASSYYVMEDGVMRIAAGSVPTVKVDNHGQVVLEQGENNIVLNTIVGRDGGAYKPDVILNAPVGNIVIENTGNKTLNSDITLGNGGKVTLSGGTFGTLSSAITQSITSSNTVLAFEDIDVYIGSGKNEMLDISLEVGKDATLTLSHGDRMHYGNAHTLKVLTGGTVELGATRQTLAGGYVVEMAGGVINGTGDQDHKISLDFYNGGTVKATENSIINAHVGGHENDATIEFNVAQEKTLTLSGNLVKTGVTKSGLGTLLYQGAAFSNALSITAGVFDYNVAKDASVSHSGAVSGSGTFRKSGEGTLTLTGGVGSSGSHLSKIDITGGSVVLDTDAFIKNSSGSGTLEIAAGKTATISADGQGYTVLNTIVGQDAKLVFIDKKGNDILNDRISYGTDNIKVTLNGGTWELGVGRQSLGNGFELVLNNGKVIGSNIKDSDGDDYGALDLIENKTGKIVSTGTSSITGGVRLRSSIEVDVQDGVLTVDAFTKSGGITKKGAGTLVITLANTYNERLYSGNTIMEGGSIKYDIGNDIEYEGTVSGVGNIQKSGVGTLTINKVESLQGDIKVDSGSLSIKELSLSHTIDVTGISDSLSIESVSIAKDGFALDGYGDENVYYSTNGTISGRADNGFFVHDGTYYLFKGKEWGGTVHGVSTDTTTSVGNTLLTLTHISGAYYVNKGTVILGGANASPGTANATGFVVKSGATLRVDEVPSATNLRNILEKSVSGTGTLIINSGGLSTSNGQDYNLTTAFAGTLELAAGITFTFGNGSAASQGTLINTDTLIGLVLNHGSKLQYNANGNTNIANVHVVDSAQAYLHFVDSNSARQVQLTGKTQLGGELTLSTTYDGGINIHNLVGDGKLMGSSGSGDFNTSISSLVFIDGETVSSFSGTLEFTGGNNNVSVSTGTGADVEFSKLSASGVKSFVFNVQTDTTVHLLNVTGGTVNMAEGATLTLGDGIIASSSTIGTLIAHSDGNTIHLDKGATLNAFTKGTGSGAITLTGSGVYDMGSSSTLNVSGLTDAQNWSGVVKIGDTTISKLNVDTYGNASSYVEFCGTSTWMDNTNTNYLTNLILSKSEDGSLNGLTIIASSQSTYNLHGSVSGEGDFIIASSGASDYEYAFKGDLSAWDGKIRVEQSTENSNAPVLDITLSGGGDIFVADGNGGIEVSRGGTVNLNIGNADEVSTLNGAVSHAGQGSLNLAVQGDTVFNADINISQMTLSGTGVDVTLYGAQNTINSPLSITSDNSLTLETGSALSVNNVIQNDGFLDIKGTLNWNITSTAGQTVEYVERTDNGLGKGVITGLITGNGSFQDNGVVSATVNGVDCTLDTATGLVTVDGLVYYVMNSPQWKIPDNFDPQETREVKVDVYSFGNGQEMFVSDVVHVGYHDKKGGPVPSADVDKAQRFYVGDDGILAIMGNIVDLENPDNIYMTAGDILESAKGTGDIILRTPGYKDTDGSYPTLDITVDSKTHVTGSLYLAPYVLDANSVYREQPGIYLILNHGADISSFNEVRYVYQGSKILINGLIGHGENGAHINNLSSSGSADVYLLVDRYANQHLVLGGETAINGYFYGNNDDFYLNPRPENKEEYAFEQPSDLFIDINHADSHITIEKLTGTRVNEYNYGILRFTTREDKTYDYVVGSVKGVLDIKSFDYAGSILLVSTAKTDDLHINLNLESKQVVKDSQLCIAKVSRNYEAALGSASLTLFGCGTYILSNGDSMKWSNSSDFWSTYNFAVLDTTWTGTVEVNRLDATGEKPDINISGINPADYGNESSTVHFKGFKGYLTDDTPEEVAIVQNLVLTNALEEVDGDTMLPAMDAYEISSGVEGQVQNYTGTISGDGDFVVSAPGNMTFNLKGNISGWAAEVEGTETPALIVKAGEHAVNFSDNVSDNATVINADLLTTTGGTMNAAISNEAEVTVTVNGVVSHAAGGTLNMTVDTAAGTTFNNKVDINSFKVSSGSVTFNNEVYLDKLEVSSGSVANVAAGASAGKVEIQSRYTEKGAAVLQNGMVIEGSSVTGGSAQNAAFEYAENGSISNTVLTDVSLSSSLQSLQEKSSISMENIVATNVYLAGDANFISLDKQTAFTWEKSVVEYGRTYNEVTFTTDSFNGMILDMSLAGNITMTVARDVAEWDNAAADALTNVTIMLEGFRVEGMSNGQRVDGWFEPLNILSPVTQEGVLLADNGTLTVAELLNPDAYLFKYYEQTANGLIIRMSNIPEPSTATLSLLALAALAARRRRR